MLPFPYNQSNIFREIENSPYLTNSYSLLKFFPKGKYAQQFLNGQLYMNSLSYFWERGFDKQRDLMEGVGATIDTKSIFPYAWTKVFKGDTMFLLDAYRYCNLLCFYRLDVSNPFQIDDGKKKRLLNFPPQSMTEFGKYVAVIKNPMRLIDRVSKAVPSGTNYVCGDVAYHPIAGLKRGEEAHVVFKSTEGNKINMPIEGITNKRDCFDKTDQYASQREWRICLFRGVKEENPYTLNVGNLEDVAEIVRVEQLQEKCQEIWGEYIPWLPEIKPSYHGNVRRSELRNLLYSFEGGKGSLITLA